MLRFVLALVAMSSSPAHALAADIRNIGCVQENVTAETQRLLRADVENNFDNTDDPYSAATSDGLAVAAEICQTKFGWSMAATEAATLYALFHLAQQVTRERAIKAGLDYGALERRFATLNAEEQTDATREDILNKLAVGALDDKEITEANAETAGVIFGFFAVRGKAIHDFTVN